MLPASEAEKDVRGESVVVENDKPRVESSGGLDDADLQVSEDDKLLGHEAVHRGVPKVSGRHFVLGGGEERIEEQYCGDR